MDKMWRLLCRTNKEHLQYQVEYVHPTNWEKFLSKLNINDISDEFVLFKHYSELLFRVTRPARLTRVV